MQTHQATRKSKIKTQRFGKSNEKLQKAVLIEEAHSSAMEGHKEVSKTYNHIRQKYFWENMKLDIQKYIQMFLRCQLKKLVRVKTKNPMVITDTPGVALEKISMDIVGPLPETKTGNILKALQLFYNLKINLFFI